MANQFTVKAKVTYINELHLNFEAIKKLKEGDFSQMWHNHVRDKNLVNKSEILILRCSQEFQKTFNLYVPAIVVKTRY